MKNDPNNNKDEIIVGYCDLCRSYETQNYGNILNDMNEQHYEACKNSHCKHPVFYIADNTNKQMYGYKVGQVKQMLEDDPNLSLDFD
tara:strand:+ start:87 stop:347 length:261 start_codon:yes stop_codon:yes gene_type:complete